MVWHTKKQGNGQMYVPVATKKKHFVAKGLWTWMMFSHLLMVLASKP